MQRLVFACLTLTTLMAAGCSAAMPALSPTSLPMPATQRAYDATKPVLYVEGRITSVEPKRQLLTIDTKSHGSKLITTNAATKVGEKFGDYLVPKTFADLKTGQTVQVWLPTPKQATDNQFLAEQVSILY